MALGGSGSEAIATRWKPLAAPPAAAAAAQTHPHRPVGTPAPRNNRPPDDAADDDVAALRRWLLISAVLTLPVLLLAMIPAIQFDNWPWLSLTLAVPVVVCSARAFHPARRAGARHGAATIDTLNQRGLHRGVYLSLYALFLGLNLLFFGSMCTPSSAAAGPGRPTSRPPVSDGDLESAWGRCGSSGRTAIAVRWDVALRGLRVVADTVSSQAILESEVMGCAPILPTGDNTRAARVIAAEVRIEKV